MASRTKLLIGIAAAAFLVVACAAPKDSVITAEVKAKMVANGSVNASEIDVTTKDRIVTLTGNVSAPEAKQKALDLARNTAGVQGVVDMISVRTASGSGDAPEPDRGLGTVVDDAGITMKVKGRLLKDPAIQGLRIDVDTRDGIVFLTGTVKNEAEKDKAVRIARETEGVRDVQPNLSVGKG